MMKRTIFMLSVLTVLAISGSAKAACYADYKAKRDNPLRLHYGVIELPDAICQDADQSRAEIETRINPDGWQLLNVLSVFGADELENRKESAGEFFLRF
ncbi:MAG: hypothetical protein V3V25_14425 [Paracoccaceae bacterium]